MWGGELTPNVRTASEHNPGLADGEKPLSKARNSISWMPPEGSLGICAKRHRH